MAKGSGSGGGGGTINRRAVSAVLRRVAKRGGMTSDERNALEFISPALTGSLRARVDSTLRSDEIRRLETLISTSEYEVNRSAGRRGVVQRRRNLSEYRRRLANLLRG